MDDGGPMMVTSPPRSVLIYDGDCGFCTSSANWFAERIGTRESIVPWQVLDLAALGLTEGDVTTAAYWVNADGATFRGHIGIAHALKNAGVPWNIIGSVMAVPPISWVASPVYKLIAKNRYKLPGSTDACKVNL